ncbi:MAG: primosomal protein N' [Pirellulales bacterium]|nr:primosomal protein N' [Pirellulales bacterium]
MPQQQSLFDTAPAPWEVDDAAEALIATVVIAGGPDGEFDYLAPGELVGAAKSERRLEAGRRVRVPLGRGNRSVVGYCVALETKPSGGRKLKSVASVVDRQSLLSPPMLRLARWMAEYYLCPLGQVLEAIVPAGVRHDAGSRQVVLLAAAPDAAERIAEAKLSAKQAAAMQQLLASATPLTAKQLASLAGCTLAPINELRKKGWIVTSVERQNADRLAPHAAPRQAALELNPDQVAALDTIRGALRATEHRTILVHGVTGSGKTEVYIQAIEEVVRYGRQAILLVPEISLTPQTVGRFRARFDRVAVLHSHLSDIERHEHWRRIARGDVQVVVGARSAIFAPTPHLGLIVLDEEHEATFKQETAPRYHARDVAVRRAADQNVPLVLASATPSLESWRRAKCGEFTLVEMPRRVLNLPMPVVRTIDLRNEAYARGSHGALSRPLVRAMEESLGEGGQVILLLNRRGHSTHIQCPSCGKSMQCPACNLSLTFHRHDNLAVCHYCDYQVPAPTKCPECGNPGIRFSGLGTQKLEAEVRARFPDYPCLRMDTDSMRGRGSHEEALAGFREGRHRILLGTQMIAKGLDFPNVTLVGVVNADTALHFPDFRAAERTFQLVTQVAGRTGRGPKGGRVLVQTLSPDAAAIVAAVQHDLQAFARQELPTRESMGYPPFGAMARLVTRGPEEQTSLALADELARLLRELGEPCSPPIRILGPTAAPIAKLRGDFRFHIQLFSPQGELLRNTIRRATQGLKPPDHYAWIVDIDPLDMM